MRRAERARRGKRQAPPALVGIDTGGTFTDLIAIVGGELRTHKLLSTPHNPADAVLRGLRELIPESIAQQVTYSTTVATNALLERKGARVLLLTTRGFEDLIEIGRQNRPELYAAVPRKPPPLVEPAYRVGVDERMLFDGSALKPLGAAALRKVVDAVRRLRPDAVAVCFLHSYANPSHERRVGAALRRRKDLFVSLSHELVSEYREYERLSTAVINAYVGPLMSGHLAELQSIVGKKSAFRVLQSNGGAISGAEAGREAVRTCLSGPAGGVMGAVRVAQALGLSRVITFDMGGTSTDVAIVDGSPGSHTESDIDGLPLKVPSLDVHTVGAGGGSLASVDAGNALKVGPQSAGADPGPACYGKGTRPTVTDANLLLGRLSAEAFLAGRMPLQRERALRAVSALGKGLGMSAEAVAQGIIQVVNASMERAIRRISVERGHDPRQYALVAFGGAAGQHACELAEALDMRRVIVPRLPGLLSAWGAAQADMQRDRVLTVRRLDAEFAHLHRIAMQMRQAASAALVRDGVASRSCAVRCTVDVRYAGQSHEINVPFGRDYRAQFEAAHRRLYGYSDAQRSVEVVNLRVSAVGRTPPARSKLLSAKGLGRATAHHLYSGGKRRMAELWQRDCLAPHQSVGGPALIAEFSATTYIPAGWRATLHRTGHLIVDRSVAREFRTNSPRTHTETGKSGLCD